MKKLKLVISFSGGRSSAVMSKICMDKYKDTHEILVIFANTGCEHPATLNFVRDCDINWGLGVVWVEGVYSPIKGEGISHKVVDYNSAARNGEPFEEYIKCYGIPNQANPSCSQKLKKHPINSYLSSIGWRRGGYGPPDYKMAIGIRADEIDRISKSAMKDGVVYPLIDMGINKQAVNNAMSNIPWDLKIPNDAYGNCVWCWKKSNRKLMTLAKDFPSAFDFPLLMENRYSSHMTYYPDGTEYKCLGPDKKRHFFRGHRDVKDIFQSASRMQESDKYGEEVIQPGLFDPVLDLGGGCESSCEAF